MMSNDLLILDELTNHLDVAMISWLKYLNASNIPFLVVSQRPYFLDNTVSVIFHLENKHLSITKGNYSLLNKQKQLN